MAHYDAIEIPTPKRKIEDIICDYHGDIGKLIKDISNHEASNGFNAIISWLNRNKSIIFDDSNNYSYEEKINMPLPQIMQKH